MKIIFLDIDGVLNSIETLVVRDAMRRSGYKSCSLDENMIERLAQIVDSTNAKIVLSSNWKYLFNVVDGKFIPVSDESKDLVVMLNKYGMSIYDMTPNVAHANRSQEIMDYIIKNYNEIDSFVIIDDQYLGEKVFRSNIIKTSFSGNYDLGLTDNHVEKAIKILNQNLTHKLHRK